MTEPSKRSVVYTLISLSRKPNSPKADITLERIGEMSVLTIDRIYRSLTKANQPVTQPYELQG